MFPACQRIGHCSGRQEMFLTQNNFLRLSVSVVSFKTFAPFSTTKAPWERMWSGKIYNLRFIVCTMLFLTIVYLLV